MCERSDFGADHFMHDWGLLEDLGHEWELVRERHKLGSRATRKQIDEVFDEIFANGAPNMRRLHFELFREQRLIGHLRTCFFKELLPPERRGYKFERVLPVVLTRLFWLIVRTAKGTHDEYRGELEYWARWWNTKSLTGELRRAIDDVNESEKVRGIQPPTTGTATGRDEEGPETDYRRRRTLGPGQSAQFYEDVCRGLSEREGKAFRDFWENCLECTEDEESRIAQRHRMTRNELNEIIRNAIRKRRGA